MKEKTEQELLSEIARYNLMGIKEQTFALYDKDKCSKVHPYQKEMDALREELNKRWTSGY